MRDVRLIDGPLTNDGLPAGLTIRGAAERPFDRPATAGHGEDPRMRWWSSTGLHGRLRGRGVEGLRAPASTLGESGC